MKGFFSKISEPVTALQISDLPKMIDEIYDQILATGFKIDHIIFIETGGRLLGYLLHERLGGGLGYAVIERPGLLQKKIFSMLLKAVPGYLKRMVREIASVSFQAIDERWVSHIEPIPDKVENILVVDDSIDTGKTIESLLKHISETHSGRSYSIKFAVINTTTSYRKINPDFLCFENQLLSFPWSRDSLECNKYKDIYETLPDSLEIFRQAR